MEVTGRETISLLSRNSTTNLWHRKDIYEEVTFNEVKCKQVEDTARQKLLEEEKRLAKEKRHQQEQLENIHKIVPHIEEKMHELLKQTESYRKGELLGTRLWQGAHLHTRLSSVDRQLSEVSASLGATVATAGAATKLKRQGTRASLPAIIAPKEELPRASPAQPVAAADAAVSAAAVEAAVARAHAAAEAKLAAEKRAHEAELSVLKQALLAEKQQRKTLEFRCAELERMR